MLFNQLSSYNLQVYIRMSWAKQVQDRYQQLLEIRQSLHSDTFGVVELKKLKLIHQESIIQKQKSRLGVTDPRITLKQLGFGTVENKDNLFHIIRLGKAKIINMDSDGKNCIKIRIQTSQYLNYSIQQGTLLLPAKDPNNLIQTLIVTDQIRAKLLPGINYLVVYTLCFNIQLKAPLKQQYSLGNIRCISYEQSMSQKKVWQITIQIQKSVKLLQQKLKK